VTHLQAVVFDMDGTLVESTECVVRAYQAAVAGAGLPVPTQQSIIDAYPLGPPQVILTHLLGRPATLDDQRSYLKGIQDACHRARVYDGIQTTLTILSRNGCRLGVFTGASSAVAQTLLGSADLLHQFDEVVGGDEVAHPKPDPEGIVVTLARLNVEPEFAAYVGDSPIDLRAATAAGTLAVGAGWGHLYEPLQFSGVVANRPRDLVEIVRSCRDA
jgi:HAD superfamily hydrolase (TIGR01509 family)